MGNQIPQTNDPTLSARPLVQQDNYTVYQTAEGKQYEQYIVTNNGSSNFENGYAFRSEFKHPQLVTLVFAAPIQNFLGCAERDRYRVVTERIPYRLGYLPDLSPINGLIILRSSLKGFRDIFKHHGRLKIRDSMIGINQYSQIKVWLNPNFSLNTPQQPFPPLEGEYHQKQMVGDIIRLIHSKTTQLNPWLDFMRFYSLSGQCGFDQSLLLLERWAGMNYVGLDKNVSNVFNKVLYKGEENFILEESNRSSRAMSESLYDSLHIRDGLVDRRGGKQTKAQLHFGNQMKKNSNMGSNLGNNTNMPLVEPGRSTINALNFAQPSRVSSKVTPSPQSRTFRQPAGVFINKVTNPPSINTFSPVILNPATPISNFSHNNNPQPRRRISTHISNNSQHVSVSSRDKYQHLQGNRPKTPINIPATPVNVPTLTKNINTHSSSRFNIPTIPTTTRVSPLHYNPQINYQPPQPHILRKSPSSRSLLPQPKRFVALPTGFKQHMNSSLNKEVRPITFSHQQQPVVFARTYEQPQVSTPRSVSRQKPFFERYGIKSSSRIVGHDTREQVSVNRPTFVADSTPLWVRSSSIQNRADNLTSRRTSDYQKPTRMTVKDSLIQENTNIKTKPQVSFPIKQPVFPRFQPVYAKPQTLQVIKNQSPSIKTGMDLSQKPKNLIFLQPVSQSYDQPVVVQHRDTFNVQIAQSNMVMQSQDGSSYIKQAQNADKIFVKEVIQQQRQGGYRSLDDLPSVQLTTSLNQPIPQYDKTSNQQPLQVSSQDYVKIQDEKPSNPSVSQEIIFQQLIFPPKQEVSHAHPIVASVAIDRQKLLRAQSQQEYGSGQENEKPQKLGQYQARYFQKSEQQIPTEIVIHEIKQQSNKYNNRQQQVKYNNIQQDNKYQNRQQHNKCQETKNMYKNNQESEHRQGESQSKYRRSGSIHQINLSVIPEVIPQVSQSSQIRQKPSLKWMSYKEMRRLLSDQMG